MVNYSPNADFVKKSKKRLTKAEIEARRLARNAQRDTEDWEKFAREAVYRQLAVRDKSTHEIRQALLKKDVPETVIETTITNFVENGLLNDEKFARTFVQAKFAEKTISVPGLRNELKVRGITGELAENALAEITEDAQLESALAFCRKKLAGFTTELEKSQEFEKADTYEKFANSRKSLDTVKRRLYGGLARRGFNPTQIFTVINTALAEKDLM